MSTKRLKRVLSISIVLLLIAQMFPINAFATSVDTDTLEEVSIEETPLPSIVAEIEEKRTAFSKTYLLEDGSYCELISTTPIHTYSNNSWNELVEVVEPTTLDEAVEVLSMSTFSTMSNVANVGDGYIESDSPEYLEMLEVDMDGNVHNGSVALGENYGIININTVDNTVYNKAQITVCARVTLQCSFAGEDSIICFHAIPAQWSESETLYDDCFDWSVGPISDFNTISGSGELVFDITNDYIKWETGVQENYGLLMSFDNYEDSANVFQVILTRQYRIVDENDSGFKYHTVDMGRAGVLYINDYTNIPYIEREELSLSGNVVPVILSRFINGGMANNSYMAGGRWNYESKLSFSGSVFTWDMPNGSSIHFQRAVPHEIVNGKEKWVEYRYNSKGYTLLVSGTPSANNTYEYNNDIIIDEEGNEYYFYSGGKLKSVRRTDENVGEDDFIYNITYDENNRLATITDAINRELRLNYEEVDGVDVVTKIIAYQNNEPIRIVTNEVDEQGNPNTSIAEVAFLNTVVENKAYLTKATYADGKSVEYSYDSAGRLTTIKNIDGSVLELTYFADAADVENSNFTPIYKYRVSEYTKKCLNEQNVLVTDFTVTINSEYPYYRNFTRKNSDNEVVFEEEIQFSRNLDILSMSNSMGESFYADYDENHNLVSLITSNSANENLIKNGDMSKGNPSFPSSWSRSGGITTSNCSRIRRENDYCVQFGNSLNEILKLYQRISIDGNQGDKFVISSWGKGEATIPRENHFWGIRILAENSSGENVVIHEMSMDTSLWDIAHTRKTAFALPFDTDSIIVQLVSDRQYGKVSFDDVSLYRANEAYVASVDDVEQSTCMCADCENPQCSCDCASTEVCECVSCDIKNITEYDLQGRQIRDGVTNGIMSMSSETVFTQSGKTVTDENGVSTTYNYQSNGLLASKTQSGDSEIQYGYNAVGALTRVSQTVTNILTDATVSMETTYQYENDKISQITRNGYSYNYDYDDYGRIQSISINSTPLITYTYNNDYLETVDTITYANGSVTKYRYDNKGNITGVSVDNDNTWEYEYSYDNNNELVEYIDNTNNTKTEYNVIIGNVLYEELCTVNEENGEIIYSIVKNNETSKTQSFFGKSYNVLDSVEYDSTNGTKTTKQTTSVDIMDANCLVDVIEVEDSFGRKTNEIVDQYYREDNIYYSIAVTTSYEYKESAPDSLTNRQTVKSNTVVERIIEYTILDENIPEEERYHYSKEILNQSSYKYDYDVSGRIIKISKLQDNSTNNDYYPLYVYDYDEAGQLVLDANVETDEVWKYTYDEGGNITSKVLFNSISVDNSTTGYVVEFSDLEQVKTISYGYDSTWKDKLVSYNGVEITYDQSGNPLNYYGETIFEETLLNANCSYEFEWNGKLLISAEDPETKTKYEYSYNDLNQRIKRKVFENVSYNVTTVNENGVEVTEELEQQCLRSEIDYIWSNDAIVAYKLSVYERVSENGSYVFDDLGNITVEKVDEVIIKPILNHNNEVVGVNCSPATPPENQEPETYATKHFYFVKDALGNSCRIYNVEEEYNFNLYYDGYGKISFDIEDSVIEEEINSSNASSEAIISLIVGVVFANNTLQVPNHYRGYIYDIETGLYCCEGRYYSPAWGRFINADDTLLTNIRLTEVNSANPFSYCANDPVNYVNSDGYMGRTWYGDSFSESINNEMDVWYISENSVIKEPKSIRVLNRKSQ